VEGYYPRKFGRVGGAGSYIQNIGREMTQLGHEVSVICAKFDKKTIQFKDGFIQVYPIMEYQPSHFIYFLNKIPLFNIGSALLFYIHNGLKIHLFLRRLNKVNKIDFVEYSEGGDFWNAILKKFPYVSHLHGSNYTFKIQSGQKIALHDILRRKAEHIFIKHAQKVISPSRAMVGYVEREMRRKLDQARVIPYPVINSPNDLVKISKENKSASILFASRNDPVKGGELLIRALELLPISIHSKICVKFYGFIPTKDLSHLKFLEIIDFVPKAELDIAYKKAHICIIPSLFDNSPNTVYEAMSNGKIVVASDVGGIPEIIGNSENGYLFIPGNDRDLCEKLTKAINLVLEGKSNLMGRNAQRWIWDRANIKENAQMRLNLIQ
jgi:glycosyltransferase involved in cell wall biosynthesis